MSFRRLRRIPFLGHDLAEAKNTGPKNQNSDADPRSEFIYFINDLSAAQTVQLVALRELDHPR